MSQSSAKQPALLIIDMQIGLFNGPEAPYRKDVLLDNVKQLIRSARGAGIRIFAARHTGPKGSQIEPGSALSQLLPDLGIDEATDVVFDKTKPSCFFGTDLQSQLVAANIEELIIAGMKTQYCIDTTCRVSAEFGFKPILVGDAHTTMETPALSAEFIINHHNATLNGAFAKVVNTSDLKF